MTSAAKRASRLLERLPVDTLVPLLAAYFALSVLYAWQAWRRETPTIFTDELEFTQIARAIAETGRPERRGEPYGFTSLVPYLTAPAWRIQSVSSAYDTVKYLQALVMALAILPAYGIARFAVSRPWAMFAAVATIAAPALSYAPILVEEPFAYPAATLALYLFVRAVCRPTRATVALALGGGVLAAATRSQLVALVGAFLLSLLVLAWQADAMRRWRATWGAWDWAGAVLLALGAVFAFSSFMGWRSQEWATTTAFWKGRIFDYGVWATGALAIGVGIVPLVATLAVLVGSRSRKKDARLQAYVVVTSAALVSLCWYAGVKGAYLSTNLSSLVVERNLIYLTPLLFTGLAALLARRDVAWWAIVASGAITLYLVTSTPTRLDQYPYYEAHGLSILALANRKLSWSAGRIDTWLAALAVVSTLLLLLLATAGRRRVGWSAGISAGLAALVLAWSLTGEIYAANGERRFSARMAQNLTRPFDWVDRATHGGSVVIVGQQVTDPTGLWLTEFWNRSVEKVWSVDPSAPAPGPGPTLTPDLALPDGTLTPSPGTRFALALNGVALQAPVVRQIGTTILYRLDGAPLKLSYAQSGVFSDGWMGRTSAYNRFTSATDGPGSARVDLSRAGFCTNAPIPGGAIVKIGPLTIGADKQPHLAAVTAQRLVRVRPCAGGEQTVLLPAPRGPWRVEVTADTFVPAEVDPRLSDRRELGVQVSFGFEPR